MDPDVEPVVDLREQRTLGAAPKPSEGWLLCAASSVWRSRVRIALTLTEVGASRLHWTEAATFDVAEFYVREPLAVDAFAGRAADFVLMDKAQRERGVIAASAGNHAQGLAYHGARLGIPVTIVMPVPTPIVKVMQTEGHGAEVVLHGETFDEAYAYALELGETRKLAFVHPFDDLEVIAGQGTVALEMLADAPEIDTLVVPIGGGGLMSGMGTAARGLRKFGGSQRRNLTLRFREDEADGVHLRIERCVDRLLRRHAAHLDPHRHIPRATNASARGCVLYSS